MVRFALSFNIFLLICVSGIQQEACCNQKVYVTVPSREELQLAFQGVGLFDFAQRTGIIDRVCGKTLEDVFLLRCGINAQIIYSKTITGHTKGMIFERENQRNLYAVLFKNHPAVLQQFIEAKMI